MPEPSPFDGPARPALCSHPTSDQVRDLFCAAPSPSIHGLLDLEQLLGLSLASVDAGAGSSSLGNPFASAPVVFLGHSTALSGELVSPLNPRAIIVGPTTTLAFNRGVQQVELVTRDQNSGKQNFYLVQFEQTCNASSSGCTAGDLFTPRVESDWTRVAIRDDEDLKNTPSDCRQCHQRGLDEPVLLMRERDAPWTHFFGPDQPATDPYPEPSGADLTRDYLAAKGDEPYAGIPSSFLRSTIAIVLESAVTVPQPLVFDSSQILTERWPYDAATGYSTTPLRSATWDAAYEAFKRGEQLALPYYAPRITDPDKQAMLTDAYQRYRSGELPADSLPDFGDVFPEGPRTRAEIGLATEPGAAPAQALVQACGECHNDVLDQSISRARFNVALSRLPRSELDEAIARLQLARGAAGSMPPPGRRQLPAESLAAVVEYLKRDTLPPEDEAFLERAAELGMAKRPSP